MLDSYTMTSRASHFALPTSPSTHFSLESLGMDTSLISLSLVHGSHAASDSPWDRAAEGVTKASVVA